MRPSLPILLTLLFASPVCGQESSPKGLEAHVGKDLKMYNENDGLNSQIGYNQFLASAL